MLYQPKSIRLDQQRLLVHIPEAAVFIEKWQGLGERFSGLSIRWAAARDAQGAFVVTGVRHEGRGFDVAFRKAAWELLVEEPEQLVIRCGDDFDDTERGVTIEIPEGSFADFVESCQQQAAEDPQKTVLGEIANYFA
ncbi:hypothetical protein [Effusibacillus pohliae]|uniref:hypothetical protein n=1 Tax=Effusibacillus pohliae TaxID=232270 RepID=UPI00036F735C|nr:hypothetical protein [Effusibacillus pohliae]